MANNIKPVTSNYIMGIHLFSKDHNYSKYYGDLFNELSVVLGDIQFDQIKIGSTDILKSPSKLPDFEIKLDGKSIIYQDILDYDSFILNSKAIVKLWQKVSNNHVKFRLFGIIRNFSFDNVTTNDSTKLTLFENYIKIHKTQWSKLNGIDLNFGFIYNYKQRDYNVRVSLSESRENINHILGFVDFNTITENKISGLTFDDIDRVVNNSEDYYNNDFIKLLMNTP